MNSDIIDIKRQGIYKKFPSFEFYIQSLDNSNDQIFLDLLDKYIKDGNFQHKSEFGVLDYNIFYAFNGLGSYLQRLKQKSFEDFQTKNIFNESYFFQAISYLYWQTCFELHQCSKSIELFNNGVNDQLNTTFFLKSKVSDLGTYLQFDMLEEAKFLTNKYLDFINSPTSLKIFNDEGDLYHRRTQYFVLRLLNNYWFKKDINFPTCAFDEPLFNQLIENWDTENIILLEHLLLCLCDRHTHQSKFDTATKFFDISDFTFSYLPFEIHTILRLRTEKGLENPILNHVIMTTPLGKFYPNKKPYMDDFLLKILKRARLEYPDFADGLFAKEGLYADTIKPSADKKPWQFWKK